MSFNGRQQSGTFTARTLVQLRYAFPLEQYSQKDGGPKLQLTLFMNARGIHWVGARESTEKDVFTILLHPEDAAIIIAWMEKEGLTEYLESEVS